MAKGSKLTTEKKAMIKLLGSATAYYPIFSRILGDVCAGVLVSRIFYWMDKSEDPDGWVYKKMEEMEEETGLTRSNQQTARKKAKELGVLEELLRGVPATMHYRVDLDRLFELIEENIRYAWRDADLGRKALAEYRASLQDLNNPVCTNTSLLESCKLDCSNPANQNAESQQSSLQEPCKPLYTLDTTVVTTIDTTGGNTPIQDHPSASATQQPPPTAIQSQQPAAIPNPGKVEEPKPIRGGSAQPAQQANGKGHLPINGYNHRQAGDGGLEAVVYAGANRAANGNGFNAKTNAIAETLASVKGLGVDATLFRELTDEMLAGTGTARLANTDTDRGQAALKSAQSAVETLVKMSEVYRTVAGIKSIFDTWTANGEFKGSAPSVNQATDYASKMLDGKVKTAKPTPAAAPDFRGCTIVDVPEPATPDYATQKARKALEEEATQISDRLGAAGRLFPAPTTSIHRDLIARFRTWNADHPDMQIAMPAGMPDAWKRSILA